MTAASTRTRADAMGNLDQLERAIADSPYDAVIAVSPENVRYAADVHIATQRSIRDRLAFVVWPRGGEPVMLVCVIEAKEGTDRDRVSDDSYRVAALVGWTWGYDITYRDVGAIGVDELDDYVFTLVPLRFVTEPSAAFEASLGATIGQTVTDRFDIQLGDAKECSNRPR